MSESLDVLQRRFLAGVMGTSVDAGLEPRSPEHWLCASDLDDARRRLAIYADMHRSRLYDVLREDYLRVHAALGDAQFADLVAAYLARHTPSSPLLHGLGADLPAFIAAEGARWRSDLADIARLDCARNSIFDAADDVALTPSEIGQWDSDAWTVRKVQRVRALCLLETSFDIESSWSALDRQTPPQPPLPGACTLLVWRRAFVVRHRRVGSVERSALRALEQPRSMADLCELLCPTDSEGDSPAESTFQVLRQWLIDGLLTLA